MSKKEEEVKARIEAVREIRDRLKTNLLEVFKAELQEIIGEIFELKNKVIPAKEKAIRDGIMQLARELKKSNYLYDIFEGMHEDDDPRDENYSKDAYVTDARETIEDLCSSLIIQMLGVMEFKKDLLTRIAYAIDEGDTANIVSKVVKLFDMDAGSKLPALTYNEAKNRYSNEGSDYIQSKIGETFYDLDPCIDEIEIRNKKLDIIFQECMYKLLYSRVKA